MIYAQIKDNVIKNTLVLENDSLVHLFSEGFDSCLRIDDVSPLPGIGWSYNGSTYSAPSAPSLPAPIYVTTVAMPAAVKFANDLQEDFISWNILHGISQLGKTDGVLGVMSMKVDLQGSSEPISLMDTLNPICPSLTTTIHILQYHIDNIANYSNLSPFITTDRLTSMQNQIKSYLGI